MEEVLARKKCSVAKKNRVSKVVTGRVFGSERK
jgi:hypothetical protein